MSEKSWPWPNVAGDRPVDSEMERLAALHHGFIGVIGGLTPTKSGAAAVAVAAGAAIINGVTYVLDNATTVTPPVGARKDYIVVRFSNADRAITLAVLQGTSGAFPALTKTTAIYEIAIASVDNSTGTFTVLDTRDASGLCRSFLPWWHSIGAAGEPAFQNSWTGGASPYPPVGFWKDNLGFVRLRGMLLTGATGTVAFTLPAGFRPVGQEYFDCNTGQTTTGRIGIAPTGEVSVDRATATYASLAGISFYAG